MTTLRAAFAGLILAVAVLHAGPVSAAAEPSVLDSVTPTTVRGGQSMVVRQTLTADPNPGSPGDIITAARAGLFAELINIRDLVETASCRDANGGQLFAGKLNKGYVCPLGDMARDEVRTVVWNLRLKCLDTTTVFKLRHQLSGDNYGSATVTHPTELTILPCGYGYGYGSVN